MKQTITRELFHAAFRELRPDNFSQAGLDELFDHLENLELETGKDIDLDVMALCREFGEGDIYDISEMYDLDTPEDEDEAFNIVLKFLEDKDVLVSVTRRDTFLFTQF